MDVHTAHDQLRGYIQDLSYQREVAEAANRQIAGLAKLIDGLVGMFPELRAELAGGKIDVSAVAGDGAPRGADAVRSILQEHRAQWMFVSELVDELKGHGWLPESDNPANAVRTALERLANSPDSDVYKDRLETFPDGPLKVGYIYDPDRPPSRSRGVGDDEEPF